VISRPAIASRNSYHDERVVVAIPHLPFLSNVWAVPPFPFRIF
jgi:hypothetical protein